MEVSGRSEGEPKKRLFSTSVLDKILIFVQKVFVWTQVPPVGDLGGRGPFLGVFMRLHQSAFKNRKLLGDLQK